MIDLETRMDQLSRDGSGEPLEMRISERQKPTTQLSIIVFGASGLHAKEFVFPSLFELLKQGKLPEDCRIYGFASGVPTKQELIEQFEEELEGDEDAIEQFKGMISYIHGKYDDDEAFITLSQALDEREVPTDMSDGPPTIRRPSQSQRVMERLITWSKRSGDLHTRVMDRVLSSRTYEQAPRPPRLRRPSQVMAERLRSFTDRIHQAQLNWTSNLETKLQQSINDSMPIIVAGRLFYLAVPPEQYLAVASRIRKFCFETPEPGWVRVMVEKPFGSDLHSAQELALELGLLFDDKQLYRIDPVIGDEIAQNLLFMRLANTWLEALLNKDHVASIQVQLQEEEGVMGGGAEFDRIGIIRDVMQCHLLQLLALVTMDVPSMYSPTSIRDAKVDLLKDILPVVPDDMTAAQYTANLDRSRKGYKEEQGVARASNQPTFASVLTFINNDRWRHVPVILTAGKALSENRCEVRFQLRPVEHGLLGDLNSKRNELVFSLGPETAVYMTTNIKRPGFDHKAMKVVELGLGYADRIEESVPDPYVRLINDCINADQKWFLRADEVEAQWAVFDACITAVEEGKKKCLKYAYGSKGPADAARLRKQIGYEKPQGYQPRW